MSARDSLPIHQTRPSRIGAGRQKVEEAVATGSLTNPLSADEVAARTGLPMTQVRVHISNMCAQGAAHNTQPGTRAARYAPGPVPRGTATPIPSEPRNTRDYEGRELQPYTGRPGAMDAFTLPSLQNGRRVERKAPAIIAANGGVRMARGDGVPTDIIKRAR
jgi:hypothetical protein